MKSREYWANRFIQLEDAQHNHDVGYIKRLDREIGQAEAKIEQQIEDWYLRLAQNNEMSMAEAKRLLKANELKEFKWTVDDYIKAGRENAVDGSWIKQLENASAKAHINRLEALKIKTRNEIENLYANHVSGMTEHLGNCYSDRRLKTAYEIQTGTNRGMMMAEIDKGKLEKIISKPWAVDGINFSDRLWNNKNKLVNTLDQALTQMAIQGQGYDKAIKTVQQQMNATRYQAARLVQTESAFFGSEAQKDTFKELGVEEFEVVATLDDRTSEICADLDGTHYPMSEFEEGVTAPPFHPNCRSTTAPYIADAEGMERIARDEDGNVSYVPADMTYNEWSDKYVMDMNYIAENNYRKFVLGDKTENIMQTNGSIKYNKIITLPGEYYASENVNLKPREMQQMKVALEEAYKTVGISKKDIPKCIIVKPNELGGANGRYDPVSHTMFITKLSSKSQKHMSIHEVFHLKDCLEYSNKFGKITNRNKVIKYNCDKAKRIIDKMGITQYNVNEITNYALLAYKNKRYDEVYVEIRTKNILK